MQYWKGSTLASLMELFGYDFFSSQSKSMLAIGLTHMRLQTENAESIGFLEL